MFYTCFQAALDSTVITRLRQSHLVLRTARTTNRVISLPKSLAGRNPENVLKILKNSEAPQYTQAYHHPLTHLLIFIYPSSGLSLPLIQRHQNKHVCRPRNSERNNALRREHRLSSQVKHFSNLYLITINVPQLTLLGFLLLYMLKHEYYVFCSVPQG